MEYTSEQIAEGFIRIHKAAIMCISKELNKIRGIESKEDRIKHLEERLQDLMSPEYFKYYYE
jgi:hypothetical protein